MKLKESGPLFSGNPGIDDEKGELIAVCFSKAARTELLLRFNAHDQLVADLAAANTHRQHLLTASKAWGRERDHLVAALANTLEALLHSRPKQDQYPEPMLRHAEAIKAASAAINAAGAV